MILIINNKREGNFKKNLATLLISSIFILAGCSRDDSSSPQEEQTPQELINQTTGMVVDSSVAGLNYTCSSGSSGVTSTLGEFTCQNNDTVSFYLGSNFISEVSSQEFVTPLALFGGNEEAALNFAQLLQTLDVDVDLSNGIEIDAELLSTLGIIDFFSPSFDEDMQTLLGDVLLVSEADAAAHLEETFITLNINADGTFPRAVVEEEPEEETEEALEEEPEPETNSAPVATFSSFSVNENSSYMGTLTATDADGDTLTYRHITTPAYGYLELNSNGNFIYVVYKNYDGDDSFSYKVNDSKEDSETKIVTITVINIYSPPTPNHEPIITSSTAVSVHENNTAALTITATDADGDTITYSISGTDATSFVINATSGVVTFEVAPDYETKNFYAFTATASDTKGASTSQNINITILDVVESATTELYIKSAVYDNNRTVSTADDKLYIYFNKPIDPASISADASVNYKVNGTGAIDENSVGDYNDTIFKRHRIQLTNSGSGTTAFITENTNISIAVSTITDINGLYPQDYNLSVVEAFRPILKTGQTATYAQNDDGSTIRNLPRIYARDSANNTVTNSSTGLMWQDDVTVIRDWVGAITYCKDLILGTFTDWRLPTMDELGQLTDKGRINPSIDPAFDNVISSNYWSSTMDASDTSNAWNVYFYNGYDLAGHKMNNYYVRCVRPTNN